MIERQVSALITASNSEAFLAYPFKMTRNKFNAVLHSSAGDEMYRSAKQGLRSRMTAGGPQ